MSQLAAAIAVLRDAFPRRDFPDATVALYGRMLADLDGEEVARAVERLLKREEFLPTIATIRREVAEGRLQLPSPEEAWDIALHGSLRSAPPEVRDAADAVGGRWTILHSDNPTTVRAQFLRSYGERRRLAIEEFTGGRVPLPPQPELAQLGPTMASLPESERAFAPPVNARWLRRMMGKAIGPATEAEKAHAIEVLRDGPASEGDPDPLYLEAERIFMEASE